MNYPYPISPYIQNAMAQAMQAIATGGPLPANCFVMAIPMQQVPQIFPQMMMNYAPGAGAMMYPQIQPYGQLYQPQIGSYPINQPAIAPPPYYALGYGQNYNYPLVPYYGPQQQQQQYQSKKNTRRGKRNRTDPHSNVYNSSSFDTDMDNISWSRLFGNQHHRQQSKQTNSDQAALNYERKGQQRGQSSGSSDTSSSSFTTSSTTSDETIRRVNVTTNPPTGPASSLKQQTKGSLPFKYSSEFVPGTGKQQPGPPPAPSTGKGTKKEMKLRSDDVFIVKKTQPSSTASKQ